MTTEEVLGFLKEKGIQFTVWRLNNLVKRGILKEPVKIYSSSKYSPKLWPIETVNKVKVAVMLDMARAKRHKVTS
ncbi:hypothetical protein [Pelosinus sp. sgz500959]|uniref:hypothetical protein n=1 Tax=Pelosinus sp. sgz500959 TaxID=3242472 RepID=UPI003672F102